VTLRADAAFLALGACALFTGRAGAEPVERADAAPSDLQSPEQRDTRNSTYSLPAGMWAFDVGALGISSGDVYAKLGAAYGVGAGIQIEANLAHWGIGLLNVGGFWHFLDTRYFDLGTRLGVWYGHGEWFWIATGPARELISRIDILTFPLAITSSMPVARFLQFDLDVQYTHAEVFGSLIDRDSAYFNAQFGMRQLLVRPGVRFFISDSTELDLSSNLPPYTAFPIEREGGEERERERLEDFETVPFSTTWSVEMGLRSRFAAGVFGSVRLHYGDITRGLYGARLYPSFEVEFRL
jgi:hypothetical protein